MIKKASFVLLSLFFVFNCRCSETELPVRWQRVIHVDTSNAGIFAEDLQQYQDRRGAASSFCLALSDEMSLSDAICRGFIECGVDQEQASRRAKQEAEYQRVVRIFLKGLEMALTEDQTVGSESRKRSTHFGQFKQNLSEAARKKGSNGLTGILQTMLGGGMQSQQVQQIAELHTLQVVRIAIPAQEKIQATVVGALKQVNVPESVAAAIARRTFDQVQKIENGKTLVLTEYYNREDGARS